MRAILAIFLFSVQIFAASHVLTPVTKLDYDKQKALLGKDLFFDASLSKNGMFSCEKCHNLYWSFSGTSKKNVKISATEQINPPSVLNAALNFIFFKDGGVKDLKEQVIRSFTSKNELDATPEFVVEKVNENPKYKSEFDSLYGNGVTFENIVDAVVNFEKAIVPLNSKFDKFIAGDEKAFNDEEKRGFELFKKVGCINCHSGVNLGANLYYELKFSNLHKDKNLTRYKIPSMRNVALTAPYLYNGEINDLKQTIKLIAKSLVSYDLSDEQTQFLYKFFLTLSGEKPEILK